MSLTRVKNGKLLMQFDSEYENAFFSVGETPEVRVVGCFERGSLWDDTLTEYNIPVTLSVNECGAFSEYLEENRPEEIGEIDFYNGMIDFLSVRGSDIGVYTCNLQFEMSDFARWYAYTLEIPAGGTVIHTVSAPLYPRIMDKSYYYEYLLSPAQLWADFSELEIAIHTEFEIADCTLDLEQNEGGYHAVYDYLPMGELTFRISGGESVRQGGSPISEILLGVLKFLAIVVPIALLIVVIVLIVRRRNRKS